MRQIRSGRICRLVGGGETAGRGVSGRHGVAEQFCDFAQELERVNGFGEDFEAVALFTGFCEKVAGAGLTGEEENAAIGIDLFHLQSKLNSVELWHHHVGEQEVGFGGMGRLRSVGGVDKGPDREAAAEKNEFERGRDYVFVIDDERYGPT
jgi:hypothetical protein